MNENVKPITNSTEVSDGMQTLGRYLIGVCQQHGLIHAGPAQPLIHISGDPQPRPEVPYIWASHAPLLLGLAVSKLLVESGVMTEQKVQKLLKHMTHVQKLADSGGPQ